MSGLEGSWDKLNVILNPDRLRRKLNQTAARVGNYGVKLIKEGIVSGAPNGVKFADNHPYTIARKGSSKPLINKGDLLGSVTYAVPEVNSVFIGVKKSAKGGANAANIAAVHEFGCTIKVTPKMRAYLHHNGLHLKKSTQYIHIPPRPFLSPIFNSEEFLDKVAEIYLKAVKEAFRP
ncbi:MAG: hypothetical protein IJP88_06820 [Synergistaceae bacterium]|nr:hypothetical protein [Synergistaceae bacterium]